MDTEAVVEVIGGGWGGGPDLRVILGPPSPLRAHAHPVLSVPQLTSGHTSLFLPSFQSPCLISPGTVTTPLAAQGLHPLLSRAEGRRCGSAAPGGGQLHLDPSRSGDQRQDGAGLVKSWGWVAEAEEMEHRVPGQRGAESIRTRLIQRVGCALRCVPTCPSLCSAAGSPDNCFPAEPSQ